MSNNRWFHKIEKEFCRGKLSEELQGLEEELLDSRFNAYIIEKISQDKIPVKINKKRYQYTPTWAKMHLEIDISGKRNNPYALHFV